MPSGAAALASTAPVRTLTQTLVVTFAMQALVDMETTNPVAYELLLRDAKAKDASASSLLARLKPRARRRLALEAINFAQLMARVPQSPRMHINLDIEDLDLVAQMRDLTGITIEIVEGSVDQDVLATTIDAIHDRGGLAAMDDFGSALWMVDAPLTYPWDVIKLDKEVLSWTKAQHIALRDDLVSQCPTAVVCLEGIETTEHLRVAQLVGANLLQGYARGRPLVPPVHPQIEFQDWELAPACLAQ
jgi:EAL domain-containing protein (putative c-di-GMP-specific phosphodiesterase class I)